MLCIIPTLMVLSFFFNSRVLQTGIFLVLFSLVSLESHRYVSRYVIIEFTMLYNNGAIIERIIRNRLFKLMFFRYFCGFDNFGLSS